MNPAQNSQEEQANLTYLIDAMIVRWVHDDQPGWVECQFTDAWGKVRAFVDKNAIFTDEWIDANSDYPRPGIVGCKIVKRWNDADGRQIVTVDTVFPWGIEATTGNSRFDVLPSQLSKL